MIASAFGARSCSGLEGILAVVIYDGKSLVDGSIAIGPILVGDVDAEHADTIAEPSMGWIDRSIRDDSCLYFGITSPDGLVGQILLHDISLDAREGLIAYHLFCPAARGRGTGTAALQLLQGYIERTRIVQTAVIITSRDNLPSQRLALRCGFRFQGAPREDPEGHVYTWSVDTLPRS
ncbi:GNAT family N-acetyltransferase [Brachybacterium tyrofermentans]|uniref:GNAT family N-acetyltransferase n=1 Tax=Brachybacterium tyrofermentans TaxID=47848 RepID=UPI003F8E5279